MKALVYHGPGSKAWEDVPDPRLREPTDAIVRIDTTTICGTDLHILKGDVPAVTAGRVLGHEGVGTITEVGSAVKGLNEGDRVIISCITACGSCAYCHQQPVALPGQGGDIWNRMDPGAPDRWHAGRVRPDPVRGQLAAQAAR